MSTSANVLPSGIEHAPGGLADDLCRQELADGPEPALASVRRLLKGRQRRAADRHRKRRDVVTVLEQRDVDGRSSNSARRAARTGLAERRHVAADHKTTESGGSRHAGHQADERAFERRGVADYWIPSATEASRPARRPRGSRRQAGGRASIACSRSGRPSTRFDELVATEPARAAAGEDDRRNADWLRHRSDATVDAAVDVAVVRDGARGPGTWPASSGGGCLAGPGRPGSP